MEQQRITGKFDAVNLSREISREAFKSMPKERRIGDKRRKQPRHKPDWRKNTWTE